METDTRKARVTEAITAAMTLGMASGLDHDALVECLAFSSAHMLSWVLIRAYCGPDEVDATLNAYADTLRRYTLEMIENHDRGDRAEGDEA